VPATTVSGGTSVDSLSLWSVLWLVCMNDIVLKFATAAVRAFVFATPRLLRLSRSSTATGSEYRGKVRQWPKSCLEGLAVHNHCVTPL
jgi:hypothetical protein